MRIGNLVIPGQTSAWPSSASYLWRELPTENPGKLDTIELDENAAYLVIGMRLDNDGLWNWVRVLSPEGLTGWALIHKFKGVLDETR